MAESTVRERRADRTEKSDSEQALKVLDGEPEVSCICLSSAFVYISDTKESTLHFELLRYSVLNR